ncbi:MAG: biopolymer transporter ExbD [Ectothiorhodospiraceae bacterium]|nr:biopolymer transporter ExbD [Ectothiorhodospiraceae bacterium]
MSVRARVRRAHRETPELNITAFMNLMVVLIPFLLLSAVFSQLSILELNLPPDSKSPSKNDPKKVRNFEVIVRSDRLIVADTIGGVLKVIKNNRDGHDFAALSDFLIKVKTRFPKKQNISILLEPNIEYELLVKSMDTVRSVDVVEAASVVKKELFPLIAIGDAP